MNRHDSLFHALNTAGHDPARRRLDPAGAQLLREAAAALGEVGTREAKLSAEARSETKNTVRSAYILGVFGMALIAVLLALPVLLGVEPRGQGVTFGSTAAGLVVLVAILGYQTRSILRYNPTAGLAAANLVTQSIVGASAWVGLRILLAVTGLAPGPEDTLLRVVSALVVAALSVLLAAEAGSRAEQLLTGGAKRGKGT